MHREWLAAEHYRMHLMEDWPEGSLKEAGLTAARSAMEVLVRTMPPGCTYVCGICARKRHPIAVVPRASREHQQETAILAA
jgi:hypothetical protein